MDRDHFSDHRPMQKRLAVVLVLVTLAIIAGVALRLAFRETVAEAVSQEPEGGVQLSAVDTTEAVADVPTAPTATPEAHDLIQIANGISFRISDSQMDGRQFLLNVCFDKPDSSNWLIRGATLELNGIRADSFTATAIEFRDPPIDGQQRVTTFVDGEPVERWEPTDKNNGKGMRCDRLSFDLGEGAPQSLAGANYSLTFEAIRMFPDEGTECDFYLNTVQASLDARNTGITLACVTREYGAEATIESKPDSMSQEEAEAIAFSGDSFKIFGPWSFNASIK